MEVPFRNKGGTKCYSDYKPLLLASLFPNFVEMHKRWSTELENQLNSVLFVRLISN